MEKNNNWEMTDKITEISNVQARKINNNNINSKCNAQNATICAIKALKDIRARISNFVPQSNNGPKLNRDTSITNVVMDSNNVYTSEITELISYESPTKKTPTNKNVAAFNILDKANKYIYFIKSS